MTQDINAETLKQKDQAGTYATGQIQAPEERFRTIVKTTKDIEVFETEVGSDVNSDDENVIKEVEATASTTPRDFKKDEALVTNSVPETDVGDLVAGVDIDTDLMTYEKAYGLFREYEEEQKVRPFKPPEISAAEAGGGPTDLPSKSRLIKDPPSVRIQRMK